MYRFPFNPAYEVSLTEYTKYTHCITHQVFTAKKEIKTLYQRIFLLGRLNAIDRDHNKNIMLILQIYVRLCACKLNYSCNRYQIVF